MIDQWSSGTHYILRSSALLCIVIGPDFRKTLMYWTCSMNGTSVMSSLTLLMYPLSRIIPCVSVIVNRLGPAAETLAPISSHMASRQPSVVALCSNNYFHHVWFWLIQELPLWVKNTFQVAFHLEIRAKTSCQTNLKNVWTPNSIQVSVSGPSPRHELDVIVGMGDAWIGTRDYDLLLYLYPGKSLSRKQRN